ncbi:MAG TPA: NADP-dependent oxidoreductase [Xanthomonadales bacterium]|nr:NADP-dependent oxidoreductase [Xanthomonadales bacterium]
MSNENVVVELVRRPEGNLQPDIFRVAKRQLKELEEGEFLMRVDYLAMDPALISRMRDEDNYTAGTAPGEVMQANGVGEVIESRNPDVAVGELRHGLLCMQQFSIQSDPAASRVIQPGQGEPRWYLGVLGTTGVTAMLALREVGAPKQGETVLISSGGSSVGSIAAQLAKLKGCRTVAIVSTDEKAAQVKADWGYDAAIAYRGKSIQELSDAIGTACPDGVDVYFDNTSGDISEAVMDHYAMRARHIVVGRMAIAHLKDTRDDVGRRDNNILLVKRVKKQGFVVFDHNDIRTEAVAELAEAVATGKIQFKEDILEGIERAPEAFFRMLDGRNKGKQLVKVV